jgi:hypothetical protein
MSVEIVRLLLGVGASEREVEAVLASTAATGKSLAKTLVDQGSPLFDQLERELARRELTSIEIVRPALDEVALLPSGLCERLGAVPVRREARSGRVDVAALDPLDPHLTEELEFHLGTKVRVLRARAEAIIGALASGSAARLPSGPPLPLIRKPPRGEEPSVAAPRTASLGPAASIQDAVAAAVSAEDDGEPVLSLSRPKLAAPSSLAAPPARSVDAEALSDVLASLEAAEAPEAAVALLIRGVAPARALVLAFRGGVYEGRSASPELSAEAAKKVRFTAGEASVIETAVRSGLYLGALPLTPAHAALRELFGGEREVYVIPVVVSGRASLVLVSEIEPFASSVELTRRADKLTKAASSSLARIVRSKKRRG